MDSLMQEGPPDYFNDLFGSTDYPGVPYDPSLNFNSDIFPKTQSAEADIFPETRFAEADVRVNIPYVSSVDLDPFRTRRVWSHTFVKAALMTRFRMLN